MKKFTILVLILLVSVFGYSQGHFNKIWSGSGTDQMTIYAVKGSINGINLQIGDEIAVFDDTDCVGITILNAELNDNDYNSMVTIICSSTDAGPKNGFIPGHDIKFKFWDASQNKEITLITPEFVDIQMNSIAAPKFASNASAFVKLIGVISIDNHAPVANAGNDQQVDEGSLVSLNGLASIDPDNDALTYLWTAPAGITLSSTTVANPTFTAPEVSLDADYIFSLVVNDGKENSSIDQVSVHVKNVDKLPYVSGSLANVVVDKGSEGKNIDLSSIFSDDDSGDFLSYQIHSNTNDQIVHAEINGAVLTLDFSSENSGKSEITIGATSNGKSVQLTFEVEVKTSSGNETSMKEPEIKIYPNPAKANIYIDFGYIPQINSWITVYDEAGQEIAKKIAVKTVEAVNLNDNPKGVYFIKLDQSASKLYKVILTK